MKKHKHVWGKDRKCFLCEKNHLYCRKCGRFKSKDYVWLLGKFYRS